MLQERTNVRVLRSTVSSQLAVPQSRLKGFGDVAFSIAASRLRNVQSVSITDCKYIGAFNKSLKKYIHEKKNSLRHLKTEDGSTL